MGSQSLRFRAANTNLGIATNVLTARLLKLVEQGIVERSTDLLDKRNVRYLLTEQGRDLYPVLLALTSWGDKWRAPHGRPLHFRHTSCGPVSSMVASCSECGATLTPSNTALEPGPGGRTAPGTAGVAELFSRQQNPEQKAARPAKKQP